MDGLKPKIYLRRPQRYYQMWKADRNRKSLDPTFINEILDKYDFNLISTPKPTLGGSRNYSLIIETSKGKKIFKQYKESLGEPTIIQEHSILNYLNRIDFPATRLVPTKFGETLLHYKNQRYALYDFVDGFTLYDYVLSPSIRKKYISSAGRHLAMLHRALKDFVPEGFNPDGFNPETGERWRDINWYAKKLVSCREKTKFSKKKSSIARLSHILDRAEYLEDLLLETDTLLKMADLNYQMIHKDFGQANVLYTQHNSPVIIDFEIARMDWKIIDLIDGLVNFCEGGTGFRLDKMKTFYNAYNDTFRLSENELVFMPIIWKFLNITKCILFLNKYCETGKKQALKKAYRFFKTIKMKKKIYNNLKTITGVKELVIH